MVSAPHKGNGLSSVVPQRTSEERELDPTQIEDNQWLSTGATVLITQKKKLKIRKNSSKVSLGKDLVCSEFAVAFVLLGKPKNKIQHTFIYF